VVAARLAFFCDRILVRWIRSPSTSDDGLLIGRRAEDKRNSVPKLTLAATANFGFGTPAPDVVWLIA
jgi:hypothetical protein